MVIQPRSSLIKFELVGGNEDEATDDSAWCANFMELCKSLDVDTSMDIIPLMLTWCKENGYDPMKPTSWLLYLDANNLYGYALSLIHI